MLVIVLVLCIIILVAFSLAQIQPTQAYLVAVRAVPAGHVLTNDDVQTRDLDPNSVPSSAVLAQDSGAAIGQQVILPFAAGDIITSSHLGSSSGDIASGVPKDMRVFKLLTKDVPMPDGLQAGDKIDLMMTIHESSGTVTTIYAVQGLIIRAIAPDASSITLWVPPSVAVTIVQAQQAGQIEILAAPPNEQFVVLPPTTSDQNCQLFIDPTTGEQLPPPLGAAPCPTPGGDSGATPTASPGATKTPRP